ncbi:putative type IX secretion system sortase PorU2 [Dyadobacter arcticus]|uniref:Gingipain domain-containing protein n=1 Tax=Dyadobacter arcticus TaxID=1078754 RepID=A0ABX0UHK9_9BACT|nr:C25 family cysteine peptidase [Dyadobacter arcticus]NIJ51504.1 hypothetical protein [Dyadobacter arcticus]
MRSKNFTKKLFLVLSLTILGLGGLKAQIFSGTYANDWLEGKYSQPWVSIKAGAIPLGAPADNAYTRFKGIYRVAMNSASLPAAIKNADKSFLQLWHRGKQVALIKADDTEILFYAVPNDGSSDAWFFRPMSDRVNPYYSYFSDESTYFLTVGASAGDRAAQVTVNDAGATVVDNHTRFDNKFFVNEYSHAVYYPLRPVDINSFYEDGKSKTGARLTDNAANRIYTTNGGAANAETFSLQVVNKFGADKAQVQGLIQGRSYFPSGGGTRKIRIYAGKDKDNLIERTSVNIAGFSYSTFSFDLEPGDVDPTTGAGVLGFSTDAAPETVGANTVYDTYSVSYYNVIYKQGFNMQGQTSTEFGFAAASASTLNKVVIANPPANVKFYDISDPDKPRIINGTATNLQFSRINNLPLTMLATSLTPTTVGDTKIATANFVDLNPASFNYLIVTNATLEAAAEEFRKYRMDDSPGVKYKAGVFKIKDIYNQFNYGEPSPIAIRRFVDFMISDNDKEKYLLLMGKVVARNDRSKREMPDEVPTVGYPSSDNLLVEGLKGQLQDVMTIPVGRVPAINYTQAHGYLEKVKTYEAASAGLAWRRKIMHIAGGKSEFEIGLHSGNLNNARDNSGLATTFNGTVESHLKPAAQAAIIPVDLDITAAINAGVGMITYFGHSAPYQTDYNFGYVSDAAKGYANSTKYAIMFYNGCDILNIFSNNDAETVNDPTSRPQSVDWLLNPNKGAVAVFGNSFSGYNESCNEYLQELYPQIFGKTDSQRATIGNILRATSYETKINPGNFRMAGGDLRTAAAAYSKRQAQLNQTVLIGDPALKILISAEGGLPVELVSFEAKIRNANSVEVTWTTSSEKDNSHFIVERSYNAKNFEEVGTVEGKGDSESLSSYAWNDNKPLSGKSYYRLVQVDRSKGENGKTIDGKKTSSRIVSVDRPFSSSLIISPNPAMDRAEIKLDLPVEMKSWKLLDLGGRVVRKGLTGKSINTADLSAGEYVLEVVTVNDDKYSKKLYKK